MNTSGRMDKLPYIYLLIFCCFTFVCMDGRSQDPSCEVEVMVWRDTTWKTAPQRPVMLECPVRHCGESLQVSWCKLLDTDACEQINYKENVEINRKYDPHAEEKLISYLNFTRISIHDNGLYRCIVKGHNYELISHVINISVSDLNQGVKLFLKSHSDNNADELSSAGGGGDVSWLPYFIIFVSITLLVVILTVLTLHFYGWTRILNRTKGQEMFTDMTVIPDLPSGTAPSTLVLHDTYSESPAYRPPSQPPLMTTDGSQPAAANTADGGQVSDLATYAVVKHRQSGIPVRELHAATQQNINAEYAAINVP